MSNWTRLPVGAEALVEIEDHVEQVSRLLRLVDGPCSFTTARLRRMVVTVATISRRLDSLVLEAREESRGL